VRRSYLGVTTPGLGSRWYGTGLPLATPRVHDDLLENAADCPSRARTCELALFADNLTDRQYAYTGGTIGRPLSPVPTIAWNIARARSTGSLEGTYRWNPTH